MSARLVFHRSERKIARVTYLVELPVPAVEDHLQGDVGPVLDIRNPCRGGRDVNAPRQTRSLKITDDELVSTRRGVEVIEGGGVSRGGDQHSD